MSTVLFLHPSDELYGADRVLLEMVDVARSSVQVEVWIADDVSYPKRELTRELEARGVRVRSAPLPVLRRAMIRPRALPGLLRRVLRTRVELRRIKADIVYVNTSALALALPLARRQCRRTILHLHEYTVGAEGRILSIFFWFAHRVVAVSEAVAAVLPTTVRRRTAVIHNGFELPRPSIRRVSDGDDPIRFLLASRWNSWKGHAEFLSAWSHVERTDAVLTIAGGPPASGVSVDVRELVRALPNAETVEIVGEQPDVRALIDACDVVVVPSVKPDPLPTIAIEAAAAGRATIASSTGGLVEIIDNGVTGVTVPPHDAAAWTRELEGITRARARTLGLAARDRYETDFTRDVFASAWRREVLGD